MQEMEDSVARRVATVEVVQFAANGLSGLVDRQIELASLEIREGAWSVLRGLAILIIGLFGLLLLSTTLLVSGALMLSLLAARGAFNIMGRGYRRTKALERSIEGWYVRTHRPEEPAIELREVA